MYLRDLFSDIINISRYGSVTIVVCGGLCPMKSFWREALWDRLGGQSNGGSRPSDRWGGGGGVAVIQTLR